MNTKRVIVSDRCYQDEHDKCGGLFDLGDDQTGPCGCGCHRDKALTERDYWREAHAQHKYEGWCPACNPREYAQAMRQRKRAEQDSVPS